MAANDNFSSARRRPRPGTLILIVLLHVAAFYGLAKAFAPTMTASVEDAVLSTFTVTVETKEYVPPPEPEPDAGASGEEGKQAVPKPTAAPEPKIKVKPDPPAPKATSTGTADTSGAREQGSGTGAGGTGTGTGSGNGGSGQGGGIATKPVHVSGGINNARDYPVPPGGREARIGTEVIVKVTVGTDGRASNCSVFKPSPDPEADRITCRLVVDRLRFKPATDSAGNPVAAPFYWRQRWF
ncbi:Gram-negative bacterial tonB protein [Tsuneonella dongtanensis]|uniref:Gram-negative bacterial tonB protein n=1 Tax=Tsuneonella dongtanensis TaxID=692370 RepID=A0A1B2A944_9SPHN|nr:TonB family protein [Tsuneonella dongtanensis]ANY18598.1 Gram-negative bacterial tonB protein [Tsuneonella dongtanensis]